MKDGTLTRLVLGTLALFWIMVGLGVMAWLR